MYGHIIFIFDFDSTFTQVEALDLLADIALSGSDKAEKLAAIAELTQKGMSGEISFSQSLQERMSILSGTKEDINRLVSQLKTKISKSISASKHFFDTYKDNIYIISSGFKDFIDPVVADFNIESSHVFANTFTWNQAGEITGFDTQNPLCKDQGKPALVKELKLASPVVVVGDGYTDYEIKKEGFADYFIAYTENVNRPLVTKHADFIAPNFNDFLNFISNDKSLVP